MQKLNQRQKNHNGLRDSVVEERLGVEEEKGSLVSLGS